MPAPVPLVKRGCPLFRVVPHPPQDQEAFRGPVMELVRHLEQAIGASVLSESETETEVRVAFAPHERLGAERFRIEPSRKVVTLRASTVDGLYHAVYCFLERAFGVRWLWPGPDGTVIPRAQDVAWDSGVVDEEPAFRWRFFGTTGCVWERYDPDFAARAFIGIPEAAQAEFQTWARRARTGGAVIADGHRWAQFCSPEEFGKSHPEYFALVGGRRDCLPGDGKHGNQPCTTHPDVIRIVAERIIAQFDARPELDGYSLAVNDGQGFCECPSCKALDDWAGAEVRRENDEVDAGANETADVPGGATDATVITDRIFKFANDVMERVTKRHPEKMLLVLVYSLYRRPPRRVRLHPNIIAQFCTPTPAFVLPDFFRKESETLGSLKAYAKKIGIYDYFEFGWRGGVPLAFPRTAARAIKMFYKHGARYYATQTGYGFALSGLHYYVASRLLWNPRESVSAIIRDFCRSGFGNAAAVVQRYFGMFEKQWERLRCDHADLPHMPEAFLHLLYPPEFILERREELSKARELVSRDAAACARVDHLDKGLDFADLFSRTIQAYCDLEALGLDLSSDEAGNQRQLRRLGKTQPKALRQATDNASRALDLLLEFAGRECGRFVYSEWWFYYFLRKRSLKLRYFLKLREPV